MMNFGCHVRGAEEYKIDIVYLIQDSLPSGNVINRVFESYTNEVKQLQEDIIS